MMSSATPQLFPGYTSPTTATFYPTSLPSLTPKGPPKPKPVNIFSNDGSFLERFQRLKKVGFRVYLLSVTLGRIYWYNRERVSRRRKLNGKLKKHSQGKLLITFSALLWPSSCMWICAGRGSLMSDLSVLQLLYHPASCLTRVLLPEKPGQASSTW